MNVISGNRALRALTGALDGLSRRQQAISDNIANAETPGYQRKSVPFEDQLRTAMGNTAIPMAVTRPGHLAVAPSRGGNVLGSGSAEEMLGARNDGNTVDLEQEMTDLAETTIRYYTVADALKSKLGTLRQIIERA